MNKKELFTKAVKAMDDYAKAVDMELPEYENYFDAVMRELLAEIKSNGWDNEFDDFALYSLDEDIDEFFKEYY